MPCYIAGPHDSDARIREILATLQRTCGPHGIHYRVPSATAEVSEELADVIAGTGGQVFDVAEFDSEECESDIKVCES
ncbi:MAG TPA: hypothetical protein VK137_18565 [Planctomycetaceae bacterium]|nr:hypothetical protein [Planctomycetaceae bacterium]